MTNQRYAGPIKYGTNLTPAEAAEIESHIRAADAHLNEADKLIQRRRLAVLEEIDSEGPLETSERESRNLTPAESADIERHILTATCLCGDDHPPPICEVDDAAESRVANRCALLASVAMLCFLALFAGIASAQSSPPVPASAVLSWTLPTTAADGSALTGPQALSEIQIFAATAAIPDNSIAQPAARVAGNATTYTHSATVPNGSTLYFRLKACNAGGCSPFSNQASRPVNVSIPGVPTGVAVTVTVVVQAQ